MANKTAAALTTAEQVLEHYGDTILRTAYTMVKNRSDAEDIAQEVLISYMKSAPAFENAEHQKAWLLRVTLNRCKSFFRSAWQSKTQGIAEDFPEASFAPAENVVLEAVQRLAPKYRDVIYLYYIEGYAAKEIAQLLGTPQNTVLSRMARARAMLKDALKGDFDNA